jgi:hypothetical protein
LDSIYGIQNVMDILRINFKIKQYDNSMYFRNHCISNRW